MLLRPAYLQKGDSIYILSTARKITEPEIAVAVQAFESWGLKVITGPTIGKQDHQYAGTDKERLDDFQVALDNPKIRAIICARGGYGTVRIMDDINYEKFMLNPKWIVGFSDVTYLQMHLASSMGVQSVHSIMPVQFPKSTPESIETLRKELFGEQNEYVVAANPLNREGRANAVLLGGNLSILYSITGTKSGFNTFGKILFLEDIDEYLYHIDRMMMNLKRSGKLDGLAGLIVGSFSDMKDNAIPFGKNAYEIIAEHAAPYSYPVCFGFPAGHQSDNRALVIGKRYNLEISKNGIKLY